MRIAIIGTGALGALYGTLLARAGDEVVFYARRGAAELRARGIRMTGPEGGWVLENPQVHEDTAAIGPCDVVIVAMKATGNADLSRLIPPLLHAQTVLVTLQNGLGSEEVLAALAPGHVVLGMLCFVAVSRTDEGDFHVYHRGSVAVARHLGPPDEQVNTFAERMRRAGIPSKIGESLLELRWRKLVWNIPFNGLSIAAGCIDTGRIMKDPELLLEVRALMDEVVAIAAAEGCTVPESFVQSQIDVTPKLGAYRPSTLIDHEAGRPVEFEAIWGEPLRRARAHKVPTPRLEMLASLLGMLCRLRSERKAA